MRNSESKRIPFLTVSLASACLVLTGCTTMLTNEDSKNFKAHFKQGQAVGVVVGQLKSNYPVNLNVTLQNIDTGKFYSINNDAMPRSSDSKGYVEKLFCVALPFGSYRIDSLEEANDMYQAQPIDLDYRFTVDSQEVKYVGNLIVSSQQMTQSGSSTMLGVRVQFAKELEGGEQKVKDQCPWLVTGLRNDSRRDTSRY